MKTHRVLIVLDDSTSTATLTQMLEAEGYETSAICRNAKEALRKLGDHGPDVILLDTSIAGAKETINSTTTVPVVDIIPVGASTGASLQYIRMPFEKSEISAVLRMTLQFSESGKKERISSIGSETLISAIPFVTITTDANGIILNINAAAEIFFKSSTDKIEGKPFNKVVRLLRASTGKMMANPAEMLTGSDNNYVLGVKNTEDQIVRAYTSVVRDRTGNIETYSVMLEDITESHRLSKQKRKFETALENVGCSVCITDANMDGLAPTIEYCNSSMEELCGWNRKALIGKPITILTATPSEQFWLEMFDTISKGKPWKGEGNARTKTGRDFEGAWSARTVTDDDGTIIACVFAMRDESHIHRLEESIRQSQKIEAVGRLASGIAHDFNNLLSVINSYCDLQILKLEEGTPTMKYAQQIRAAGRKGVDLVSQLMTFSHKDRPNPTTLDLAQVIEEVKGMLRRVIREDIEMETHSQGSIAHIKADQGQIEQVLLNLCVNARDAMPNGGRLIIEIINRDYDKAIMRGHDTIRQGRYAVLSVTDSGCGMDEETQKRIFDPFFTTKEIGKGTGLGLATVHSIMKQYGGHILVKSRPGEGTRFELLFPACDEAGEKNDTINSGSAPAPTGSEKIFIVEDDETFLDCISSLLRLHGYQVYTASDGTSALDMLSHIDFDIDLLVSDLVLPKLSGREIAARVMEKNSKTKILFMTGYDDQLDTFYALPNDATILEKPFPLNSMLVKVRSLLDEQTPKTE